MTTEDRQFWNAARFRQGGAGHYESWFQRANHPSRPQGFWIRYTIFVPADDPTAAQGELWAIWFDGDADAVVAVKEEVPLNRCRFDSTGLSVDVGDARLNTNGLQGEIAADGHRIAWDLEYESTDDVLLTFPRRAYDTKLPKAKALVGSPNAIFRGALVVDGESVDIDGWVGSQNHNWGSKHTDRYAWAQVCEFDDTPGSYLEVATAQLKIGPLWTPRMTLLTLRLDGQEYGLSDIVRWFTSSGTYDYFDYRFESGNDAVHVRGRITADRKHFVGLPYRNPPGGTKTCLNSKIARCELEVTPRGGQARTLVSQNRAAFEILTDDESHGIPVLEMTNGAGGLRRS